MSKRKRTLSRPAWEAVSVSSKDKCYVVFDFRLERPKSKLTVPETWITDRENECYWPKPGSSDEKRVAHLIRQYSEPNVLSWIKLPGRVKGKFDSFVDAESYIRRKGTTESEDERLSTIAHQLKTHYRDIVSASSSRASFSSCVPEAVESEELPTKIAASEEPQAEKQSLQIISKSDRILKSLDTININIMTMANTMENFGEELKAIRASIKTLEEEIHTKTGDEIPKTKKITALESQEIIRALKLPLTLFEQFSDLESRLNDKDWRSRLRGALSASLSKEPNPNHLHIARKAARVIAADRLFQCFTSRNKPSKNVTANTCLPTMYPKLFEVLISVIMHKSDANYDKAVSALGRHFSKCRDRKTSKTFQTSEVTSDSNDS